MATSLDYLRWRGDLNFNEKPFNSVDASLLASIVYLPADESACGHTLAELAKKLHDLSTFKTKMRHEARAEIFLLPKSPRLGELEILDWTNRVQKLPNPLQFSAATFRLTETSIAVAFRGTDTSMIGWSEDMVMNYTPEIYGQTVATEYLAKMADKFPNDRIYVLGHSKGGNFAHYALSASSPEIQDRVIKSLNFDGPGFYRQVFTSSGFKRSQGKMKTYLPEDSVVGAMLDHPERTLVIKSDVPMSNQHDPRHWNIGRDSFVLAEGLSTRTRVIRHSLIHYNHSIPNEKRSKMFAALFEAFENSDIKDVSQLTTNKLIGTYRFSKILLSLDPELRQIFLKMFTDILETYRSNLNLPFIDGKYQYYPKSNDSKKAPVFFEFYDLNRPNITLDSTLLKQKYNQNKTSK